MKKILGLLLVFTVLLTSCAKNNEETLPPTDTKETKTTENIEPVEKSVLEINGNDVLIGESGLKFTIPENYVQYSDEEVLETLEYGNEALSSEMTEEEKTLYLDSTLVFENSENYNSIQLMLDSTVGEITLEEFTEILSNPLAEETTVEKIEIEGIPANLTKYKLNLEEEELFYTEIALVKGNDAFIAIFTTDNEGSMDNLIDNFSK
ncbi:hypothetical protein [Miniphocaeibacter halophilus]|uniref:Uncharacterized protein n=1 Tax=Miniphocaeibacter halophilus TaxID=2931922 RepID=A0AC61MSP4_9FIRM|nr:hypothetical protein [Miniphocaeibacter halophilus]QQK08679.1 hypothetical protein JFY71_03820 [Miniphocaeibacter halophilus]